MNDYDAKEMSLLQILKLEDDALTDMKYWGNRVSEKLQMLEKVKRELPNDSHLITFYKREYEGVIEMRDEYLLELNEARELMKEYFEYHGLRKE